MKYRNPIAVTLRRSRTAHPHAGYKCVSRRKAIAPPKSLYTVDRGGGNLAVGGITQPFSVLVYSIPVIGGLPWQQSGKVSDTAFASARSQFTASQ